MIPNSTVRASILAVCVSCVGCGGGTAEAPLPLIGTSRLRPEMMQGDSAREVLSKGTWHSQVDFHWVVQDRNSSYVDRVNLQLWIELVVAEDRSFVLRVHQEQASANRLVGPYSRMRGRSTVQSDAVTDSYKGTLRKESEEIRLRVEIPGKESRSQEFRCAWVRDADAEYVHCAPMDPYTAAPSKDTMQPYLRAPLVFSADERFHAVVTGDHRVQSVSIEP